MRTAATIGGRDAARLVGRPRSTFRGSGSRGYDLTAIRGFISSLSAASPSSSDSTSACSSTTAPRRTPSTLARGASTVRPRELPQLLVGNHAAVLAPERANAHHVVRARPRSRPARRRHARARRARAPARRGLRAGIPVQGAVRGAGGRGSDSHGRRRRRSPADRERERHRARRAGVRRRAVPAHRGARRPPQRALARGVPEPRPLRPDRGAAPRRSRRRARLAPGEPAPGVAVARPPDPVDGRRPARAGPRGAAGDPRDLRLAGARAPRRARPHGVGPARLRAARGRRELVGGRRARGDHRRGRRRGPGAAAPAPAAARTGRRRRPDDSRPGRRSPGVARRRLGRLAARGSAAARALGGGRRAVRLGDPGRGRLRRRRLGQHRPRRPLPAGEEPLAPPSRLPARDRPRGRGRRGSARLRRRRLRPARQPGPGRLRPGERALAPAATAAGAAWRRRRRDRRREALRRRGLRRRAACAGGADPRPA